MNDVATLRPHLERCCEEHRIVFWHDSERQHKGKSDVGEPISL
jgi:hypothetical protein